LDGEFWFYGYYLATVDKRRTWSKIEKYIQKKGKSNNDFCCKESHIKMKKRTAKVVLSVLNGKLTETISNSQVLNRRKIYFLKRRLKFEKK